PRLEVADPGHGGIGRPGEERQREEPEEAGKRPHAPGEERSRGGTVNARPPRVTRDASPRRFASPQTDGATWTSEPTAATRGRKWPTRRRVGRGFGERRALRMAGARRLASTASQTTLRTSPVPRSDPLRDPRRSVPQAVARVAIGEAPRGGFGRGTSD